MINSSKRNIGIICSGIITLMLLSGCSVTPKTSPSPVASQKMMGEVTAESYGDGKVTPGNPAKGEFPKRSDGTPRYMDVSIDYPQGAAFVQGFRKIFPTLDENEYRKGAKYPLRNAQEVCGMTQLGLGSPQSMANDVRERIKLSIKQPVTQDQANAVYNLSIDTVCPAYTAKKIN